MNNIEDSFYNKMRELNEQRKGELAIKSKKYDESSKKHLGSIIETKLRTSFIAPLHFFEQAFGHLWGHGKKDSELTVQELNFKNMWINVRTEILNNGNNQIRAIFNELVQYTVTWNRYQKRFIVNTNQVLVEEKTNVREEKSK